MSCKIKKESQLGINPSTASGRLTKDILYSLVVKTDQNNCYHCGEKINREDFSIEHKIPWLDSEDPQHLFFDLNNIAFSHLRCNVGAARQTKEPPACGTDSMYNKGCRCDPCKAAKSKRVKDNGTHTPEKRRERFLRSGR